MKQHRERFFKIFLIIYIGFLIPHSLSLDWASWVVPLSLAFGLAVAAIAHTQCGILTICLLIVHMSLEWTEHAGHGWHYSAGEIALHCIHACLDFMFLYQELRIHIGRFYRQALAGIACFLGSLFAGFHQPAPGNPYMLTAMKNSAHTLGHEHHGNGPIEPFVMGGMFGCLLSHLLRKRPS